jgi:hypothetical protein
MDGLGVLKLVSVSQIIEPRSDAALSLSIKTINFFFLKK